jgi:hypothetical protein
MSSPPRWSFATSLATAILLSLSALGQDAGRRATDAFTSSIRAGTAWSQQPPVEMPGWDNDAVIDALMEVIAAPDHTVPGQGIYSSMRETAASRLAYRRSMQKLDDPWDSRGLQAMLPARIAPALLVALAEAKRTSKRSLRGHLLVALGALDEPPSEAVAVIRAGLTDPDWHVVDRALTATGTLGFHASGSANDLERMLDASPPGRWVVDSGRWRWDDMRMEIAGGLARVSSGSHPQALDALMACLGNDRVRSAERAIAHLRDLAGRAAPAIEELIAVLRHADVGRPVVSPLIAAIAPDRFAEVVELLAGRAASGDMSTAWPADRELLALSQEHGATDELRSLTPGLVAALDARSSAADGLQLAKVLRQIDSPEAQTAFEAHRRRERHERGAAE